MLNIKELENGNKEIIVPRGIRYISEWRDYNLSDFNFPHILDKKIPGCGFTEYCITSENLNVILCSPRKILLENKEAQHPDTVLYFKNELEFDLETDKDITKDTKGAVDDIGLEEEVSEIKRRQIIESMENELNNYISYCRFNNRPAKILVTYDSFRLVKQFLIDRGVFDLFYVVVDEMQSVFCDASFKSDTELGFMYQLQDLKKVCYVSATPMIDKYLTQVDEFKDLPYYELDWASEDPLRVITPDFKARVTQSITGTAEKIIKTYKDGNFKALDINIDGVVKTVVSKEAVIYVNSVANIISIIKKCELAPEECNILCAKTTKNILRIKKRLGKDFEIGKVPLKGEPHKMFTFCTRTVYLGADFYSTCARSFILSDANIKTLAVDIRLDIPQILGRQRLIENPWKNRIEMYYKTLKPGKKMSAEEFNEILKQKRKKTKDLLNSYADSRASAKPALAEEYQKLAKTFNYKDHYVAVNVHAGNTLVPVENKLVYVAEQRAFDIEQIEYGDWFSVFNTIQESSIGDKMSSENVSAFLDGVKKLSGFYFKLRALCEAPLSTLEISYVLEKMPIEYKNYYETLGPERCKALGYKKSELDKYLSDLKLDTGKLDEKIYSEFIIGSKYTNIDIKNRLADIYSELKYNKTPKATDLDEYFVLKECLIQNKDTGKRDRGFEIIKKK